MAKEIDTLIKDLGGDTILASHLGTDPATVLKWRKRNRVPMRWIPPLVYHLRDKPQHKHITTSWLLSVNLKSATKRKR